LYYARDFYQADASVGYPTESSGLNHTRLRQPKLASAGRPAKTATAGF